VILISHQRILSVLLLCIFLDIKCISFLNFFSLYITIFFLFQLFGVPFIFSNINLINYKIDIACRFYNLLNCE